MRKEDKWNKQGKHEISGDGSCEITSFKLPETDTCHERRNFPGYETYVPGEALMDAISCEGTTETRSGRSMNSSHKHAAGEMKRAFR